MGPTQHLTCPLRGQPKPAATAGPPFIFTLPLSLVLALSLSTLSHSSKGRRRKGRRRGGDWRPPAAAHHHGFKLRDAIHKRWGLEEGGALSSSPFGARRRRNHEKKEELEPTKGRSSISILGSLSSSLLPFVRIKSSQAPFSCFT